MYFPAMAEKGLQKPFETTGIFWLPERVDHRLPGHLKHSTAEFPQVTLVGSLNSRPFSDFPVIHGVLDDAPCTLFDCQIRSSRGSASGIVQTVIDASLLLVGEHVSSMDDAQFEGLRVRFDGLDEWVDFRAISIDADDWLKPGGPSKFDLQSHDPVVIDLNEAGVSVKLVGRHNGEFGNRYIDWAYHSFFDVDSSQPLRIQALCDVSVELQSLLALLTWHRTSISYLSIYRSVPTESRHPDGKAWSGLYGNWSANVEGRSFRSLTNYDDVGSALPQVISSWFSSPPAVKIARRLITSIIQAEGLVLDFGFLTLMQAAEALHRALDPNNYTSETEYQAIEKSLIAAIPASVTAEHRASLKSRIKYANELSLRTRLKALFQALPEGMRGQISSNWKEMVGKAVNVRNDLTHPNTAGTNVKLDANQMWQLFQQMKLLLTIVLLNNLGMAYDQMEIIAKNQDWRSRVSG